MPIIREIMQRYLELQANQAKISGGKHFQPSVQAVAMWGHWKGTREDQRPRYQYIDQPASNWDTTLSGRTSFA